MANEYTNLVALKAQLRLDPDDTTADALLTQAIATASRFVERLTGRRFWLDPAPVQRIYRPTLRAMRDHDGEHLLVDDIGSLDGLVVELGGPGSWTTTTNYETTPDNALTDLEPITALSRRTGEWDAGYGLSRVRVTARWGWPAIPDDVVQATQIQALRLYRRKDSPEGVLGSADWGVMRLGRVDPDVAGLLEALRLPGFG
ncbi:hypothetical protein B4N89_13485 [Embleya scabrispora]|uniref:Phage gp6-like head-tail connector protein n=1 Tax=Embleya scabrispora TaxID=159449 RepID=A0A1T3NY99_9ACTN|nr:head-tail connector protein [Embleya scabrispora]OPC81813.1 hypothetical protein B4N89_13485 [Embleya scabrispora]